MLHLLLAAFLAAPTLTAPKPSVYVEATSTVKGLVGTGAQTFGGVKTFSVAPDLSAGTTNAHYIDARAYGFKTTNTGAQNVTALNNAITAAIAAGKELHIPAGTFKINVHGYAGDSPFHLVQSLTIRGAGMLQTKLKADGYIEGAYHGPVTGVGYVVDTANDNNSALFFVGGPAATADFHITISDLMVEGPDIGAITMDQNGFFGIYSHGGGYLNIERVKTYLCVTAIKMSPDYPDYPGRGTHFTLTDSYIKYFSVGVLHIDTSPDLTNDSNTMVRDVFEYNYEAPALLHTPEGNQSNGHCHATYINRGISWSTTDVQVLRTTGNGAAEGGVGLLHYGIGVRAPRYARHVNPYIGPYVTTGIITSSTAQTTITGGSINTGTGRNGILIEGETHISNTKFTGDAQANYAIVNSGTGDVPIDCVGCTFGKAGNGDGYGYFVGKIAGPLKPWRFIDCQFGDVHSDSAPFLIQMGRVEILNSIFASSTGIAAAVIRGGTAVFDSCRFSGAKGPYVETSVGSVALELYRNTWTASGQVQVNSPAPPYTITVKGADNHFYDNGTGLDEGFQLSPAITNLSYLSGDLQCGRGLGTYDTDTGYIRVSYSFDTYEINESGTPTFNNIYMRGSSGGNVGLADNNRWSGCTIHLLVKQAFALGSSGNIIAAAGTRVVNSIVSLRYFPSLTKWVEI